MFAVTKAQEGIGLAAIQLGIAKRVLVINNRLSGTIMAMVNPTWKALPSILSRVTAKEGCLSAPGVYVDKERYTKIEVQYQNLSGKFCTIELTDLDARVFQHEYDHLEGIICVE